MDLKNRLLTILEASLYHHHQVPLRINDQVLIGVGDFTVGCAWTQQEDHGRVQMVAAGLEVRSPGLQIVLQETVAGVANTVDGAIAQAITVWQHGQFEAVQAAFTDPPGAPEVRLVIRDDWTDQSAGWDIYSSSMQVMGQEDTTLEQSLYDQSLLARLGPALSDELEPASLTLHWIKLYAGQSQPGELSITSWFDNFEWPESTTLLQRLPWPSSPGYLAVRQFFVLKPASAQVRPDSNWHLTRSAPPRQVLMHAVQLIAAQPQAEDSDLVEALVAQGVRQQDAEKLVVFLPLAAGRSVLQKLTVLSPMFMVQDAAGAWIEYPLEGEPVYRAAWRLLSNGYGASGLSKEGFGALVMRSVEMQLINDALNAGRDVSGAVLSPMMVLRLTAADFGPPPEPAHIPPTADPGQ